jgi:hypothetical protein
MEKGYIDENTDMTKLSPFGANFQTPDWTKEEIASLASIGDWSVNATLSQKIIHPVTSILKDPKRLPKYVVYFTQNIIMRKQAAKKRPRT